MFNGNSASKPHRDTHNAPGSRTFSLSTGSYTFLEYRFYEYKVSPPPSPGLTGYRRLSLFRSGTLSPRVTSFSSQPRPSHTQFIFTTFPVSNRLALLSLFTTTRR